MMPCHSCQKYGACRGKEVRGDFKVIIWRQKTIRGGGGGGGGW